MKSLLERVASGDEAAVELCVREYAGLVYRLASRYLDRAQDEIDDAVQDVFIEVWSCAKRYDETRGSEAAFIATIAHRRIIDRQRQISTRRRIHRQAGNHVFQMSINASSGSDPDASDMDERSMLASVYNELPEPEREAIWMSVYAGLTHREIGIATNSPIGTVKTRLRRAMMRMSESVIERCSKAGAIKAGKGGGS